uniref:Tafazzin family protein n=1 Tax=Heterorhabditis bacteriophora TaxID=37862 RepID=A0A1I7XDX8_HETBA
MGFVSSISKFLFIGGVNKIIVHNKQQFMTAWEDRSRPLITVANHRSNIDDPLMWTMLSIREMIRNIDRHRYTLAAHNICFSKQWHTNIFSLGRCVPCVRGAGVYQEGMNFCVDKLNQNGWVHIFPEGRVTESPLRFKWGIGRLIMDSKAAPVVLPIWCTNMQKVWPVHPPYYPRFGHVSSFLNTIFYVFYFNFYETVPQHFRITMVSSRKQSIVEAAEQHFDKNTIILIVNLIILTVLMGLLYMVATSAMAAGGKDEH